MNEHVFEEHTIGCIFCPNLRPPFWWNRNLLLYFFPPERWNIVTSALYYCQLRSLLDEGREAEQSSVPWHTICLSQFIPGQKYRSHLLSVLQMLAFDSSNCYRKRTATAQPRVKVGNVGIPSLHLPLPYFSISDHSTYYFELDLYLLNWRPNDERSAHTELHLCIFNPFFFPTSHSNHIAHSQNLSWLTIIILFLMDSFIVNYKMLQLHYQKIIILPF